MMTERIKLTIRYTIKSLRVVVWIKSMRSIQFLSSWIWESSKLRGLDRKL